MDTVRAHQVVVTPIPSTKARHSTLQSSVPPVLPPNSWIDQPTTQAGNARTRVFVACQACRSRKIKCDGLKPVCTNCVKKDFAPGPSYQHLLPTNERHKLTNGICSYDPLPKRRGPDRLPGARVRKKSRAEDSGHERGSRRRATADSGNAKRPGSPQEISDAFEAITTLQIERHNPLHYPDVAHDPVESVGVPEQQYQQIHSGHLASNVPSLHIDSFYATSDPHTTQPDQRRTRPNLDILPQSPPGSSSGSDSLRSPQRILSSNYDTTYSRESPEIPTNVYRPARQPGSTFNRVPSISPLSETPVARIARGRRESWNVHDAPRNYSTPYPVNNPSYEYVPSSGAYIQALDDSSDPDDQYRRSADEMRHLPVVPGSNFVQKTWFDSLLDTYAALDSPASSSGFYQPSSLSSTSELRLMAHNSIIADLRALFARSSYWFSFIHVPSFWAKLHSPERRTSNELQPGLLLSALALAVFFKSNEAEGGTWGRERASRLKAEAEAAVESSLAVGWVDVGLAQAAWLLAMYEINPHPYHSLQKTRSAMARVDNVIRLLKCTSVDADNPAVTRFDVKATPLTPIQLSLPTPSYPAAQISHHHHAPTMYTQPSNVRGEMPAPSDPGVSWPAYHTQQDTMSQSLMHQQQRRDCGCNDLCLGQNAPETMNYTPLWRFTASWANQHEPGEIRREEARRIVWAFVTIAASFGGHTATLGTSKSSDVFWSTSAENFALLYPGEAAFYSNTIGVPSTQIKESVWALYARAQLLWLACLRMRQQPGASVDNFANQAETGLYSYYSSTCLQGTVRGRMSESEIADFAMKAWLQTRDIEAALDAHTCDLERAYLFHGREYLSNVRMIMTQDFSRYVPFPNSGTDSHFNRLQADDWLKHQSAICGRLMSGMRHVTGHQLNVLADRPFFVWWFMIHVVKLLNLWACDHSMTDALELCFSFLPAIDYLTSLWPSENQRNKYLSLRQRLDDACHQSGIPLPPPPTLPPQNQML